MLLPLHLNLQRAIAEGPVTTSVIASRLVNIDWKNNLIENKVVNVDWTNKTLIGNRIFNIDYTQGFGYSPTINIDNLITLVLINLTFPLDISVQKLPNGVFLLESRDVSWILNTNNTIWTLNSVPVLWTLNNR